MRKDVYRVAGITVALVAALAVSAVFYKRAQDRERAAQAGQQPPVDWSLLVRPHSHSLGPADAKVTIIEFLDPECESCRAMHPLVKHLLTQYQGQVRLVVRYMPFHANSIYAASALEAAGEQGKYWQMLETLFLNQPHWGNHHHPRPELIPDYARQVGLVMEAFEQSVNNPAHRRKVEIDQSDGRRLGVQGTPTFFVNGKLLDPLGYEPLKRLIDDELARQKRPASAR